MTFSAAQMDPDRIRMGETMKNVCILGAGGLSFFFGFFLTLLDWKTQQKLKPHETPESMFSYVFNPAAPSGAAKPPSCLGVAPQQAPALVRHLVTSSFLLLVAMASNNLVGMAPNVRAMASNLVASCLYVPIHRTLESLESGNFLRPSSPAAQQPSSLFNLMHLQTQTAIGYRWLQTCLNRAQYVPA